MIIIDQGEVSRSGILTIAEVPHCCLGLGVLIAARTPRPTEVVEWEPSLRYAIIRLPPFW